MQKSDCIKELAAALAKAQGQMEGAKKSSANPYFKSRYADLAEVWEACRKPLSDNGLAIIQTTTDGEGRIIIETTLAHSSGEWITSTLGMTPVKTDPQGIGSAITYARRYALSAMVGIAPEDDDGEAAMGRKKGATAVENLEPRTMADQSIAELKKIRDTMLEQLGWDKEKVKEHRQKLVGDVNLADMTQAQWVVYVDALLKEVENAKPN